MNTEPSKVKTEKQKMLDGEYFNACEKELMADRVKAKEICFDYNQLRPSDKEKRKEIIKKLFKKTGNDFHIESNFYCDYGYNITIGEDFYSNHNLVILDGCEVTFGNNVMIGPNCGFYTAAHPIDVDLRNECVEFGKKIIVGNNVWFGGNVCVLPGVTIGDNVTIGAGSVVTRDIPSNVTAFGNPCRVHKVNEENVNRTGDEKVIEEKLKKIGFVKNP